MRADGHVLPYAVDPSVLTDSNLPTEADHDQVAVDAATTGWNGQHLDRHYAIGVLAQDRG